MGRWIMGFVGDRMGPETRERQSGREISRLSPGLSFIALGRLSHKGNIGPAMKCHLGVSQAG